MERKLLFLFALFICQSDAVKNYDDYKEIVNKIAETLGEKTFFGKYDKLYNETGNLDMLQGHALACFETKQNNCLSSTKGIQDLQKPTVSCCWQQDNSPRLDCEEGDTCKWSGTFKTCRPEWARGGSYMGGQRGEDAKKFRDEIGKLLRLVQLSGNGEKILKKCTDKPEIFENDDACGGAGDCNLCKTKDDVDTNKLVDFLQDSELVALYRRHVLNLVAETEKMDC
eukprot:g3005.t1